MSFRARRAEELAEGQGDQDLGTAIELVEFAAAALGKQATFCS